MPSSNQLQFFLARAEDARREAANATLAHVRERCERSEAAWNELAGRAARAEAMRAKVEEMNARKAIEEKTNEHSTDEQLRPSPRAPQPCED